MTTRLRWILFVGGLAIEIVLGVRVWRVIYFGVANAAEPYGAEVSDSQLAKMMHLPGGFTIHNWATGIAGARAMRFTPHGDLLVSSPQRSAVFLVAADADGDGRSDGIRILLDKLQMPHGLALHDDWLYFAETNRVSRVHFDAASGQVKGKPQTVIDNLPSGGHWSRTIGFGPDGWLYLAVGSSCNVCIEADRRRAAITRYQPDGSDEQPYASGLRNSVGFTWQPGTGAMFATDNGRDMLGDDFPPCELNRIAQGGFYGWPFANGMRVVDPDLGAGHETEIARSQPPVHAFGAHVAPLGLTFYTGTQFPAPYRERLFVAQHGSWNRSRKSGYKVVSVKFKADGTTEEEDFVAGFEKNENVYGRPVDVAQGPDGALYVSDDYTGSIYRVAYQR